MSRHVLPITLAWALGGCGALIGNPGPKGGSETGATGFIKLIDYEIPTSVSGYALASAPPPALPDGLFRDSMNRFATAIDRINELTRRLDETDRVSGPGTYTGLGPDGQVSLVISDEVNGDYDTRAVLCSGGAPFQLLEWSSATGDVHAIRSYAVDPMDPTKVRDMVSEITYAAGDPAEVRQSIYATPPGGQAPPGMNGPHLGELIESTRSAGRYTMAGVHNWVDDPATLAAEGDEYFVGAFTEDGVGETVGYNRGRIVDCPSPFDEDGTPPNWCTGLNLSGEVYRGATLAAAVQRLSGIPVARRAGLAKPALPGGLACP